MAAIAGSGATRRRFMLCRCVWICSRIGTVKAAKSNVLLSNLALTRLPSGLISATISLTNTGTGPATDVTFASTLGGFVSTPASSDLGALASKATATTTVTFPTFTAGQQVSFVLTGSDGVNTISSTVLVTIPK